MVTKLPCWRLSLPTLNWLHDLTSPRADTYMQPKSLCTTYNTSNALSNKIAVPRARRGYGGLGEYLRPKSGNCAHAMSRCYVQMDDNPSPIVARHRLA
jgi:hypothetical protein